MNVWQNFLPAEAEAHVDREREQTEVFLRMECRKSRL